MSKEVTKIEPVKLALAKSKEAKTSHPDMEAMSIMDLFVIRDGLVKKSFFGSSYPPQWYVVNEAIKRKQARVNIEYLKDLAKAEEIRRSLEAKHQPATDESLQENFSWPIWQGS